MIRKWISIFLVLTMLISVTPVQALSVSPVRKLQPQILINPEYADIISAEDITEIPPVQYGKLDYGESYLPLEEAAIQVREAMKRRETSITVNFYINAADPDQDPFAAFHAAMVHTGNPTEGDYLAKQYHSCGVSGYTSQGTADGIPVTQFGITYTVTYMTNAEQEAQMDTAVAALLASLNLGCADDYTKFITVYDYICENITYDYDNLSNGEYLLKHSAYAALVNKTAVCQGYALLLYRLMLELGVDCRYISGMAFNGVETGSHGWNIVELDGKYYNADSTWDAGGYEYMWCLQSQETFKWHTRDEEYDTAAFHAEYSMAAADYVYSGNGTAHTYIAVVTPPTCATPGYTTYTCQVCSDSYIANNTAALGHSYVDGICSVCEGVQIVASGTCGENVTWTLDGKGTLTISGTGKMDDYNSEPTPWDSNCASIKNVVIENGVTSIGSLAFIACSDLSSIAIGDSVTGIGERAFYDCYSLTAITIPDSVTTIGDYAFFNCSSLTTITIPDNVTTICNWTFAYCSSLTSVTIGDGVTSIGNDVFYYCSGLTSITIGDSVTDIGKRAFYYCSSLTSVTLPDDVTRISESAFENCSSLTSITIPDSVSSIDDYAFLNCSGLTSITIPDSVSSIGNFAFLNCSGLTAVAIGDSVTSIGESAFYGCNKLATVIYCGTQAQWDAISIDEDNDMLIDATLQLHNYENGVCTICQNEQSATSVASGTCGDNLTWILDGKGTLTISGTGKMNDYDSDYVSPWYSNRSSIKTAVIENGVTTIGGFAFYNCDNLTSVTIGDSVTTIGSSAFSGCTSLTGIWVDKNNAAYSSDSYGVLFDKNKTVLVQVPGGFVGTYAIPDGVTSVGDFSFYHCVGLTNVTIPDSVTTIGTGAFNGCTGLTNVTIPNGVTSILEIAFSNCTGLTNITIPNSVTKIGIEAFTGCTGLTNIIIPNSVTNIGGWMFAGCTGLSKVTIPSSVAWINIGAFNECNALADVYYSGTLEQWNQILIASYNTPLKQATLHTEYAGCVYGDATGDSVIDGMDVIRLKKYLANYNYETGVSNVEISAGADATGDGIIDGMDVIRLKKYLANFNYETGTSTVPLGPQ